MTTFFMSDPLGTPGKKYPKADNLMRVPEGWHVEKLTLATADARVVDALVPDDANLHTSLAVHRMVDDEGLDDGWTISTLRGGYRITYGAKVFAYCTDAVTMAEDMMHAFDGWADFASGRADLTPAVRSWMRLNWQFAEDDDQFIEMLVTIR